MGKDVLPTEEETWEQFARICQHPLFSRSANHQALLRELIRRVYAGSNDFAAKVLAPELFGRDTSIAKVEGRSLRAKLESYYRGDGRDEPIVIRIPNRTFKPEIRRAIMPLPVLAGMMRLEALNFQLMPSAENHESALRVLTQALEYAPNHPYLTGPKAMIHANRAIYGGDPRVELEIAQHLTADVYSRQGVSWEATLVNAAIFTGFRSWGEAAELFHAAFEYKVEFRPLTCSPWHLIFLAAQRKFDEAIDVLSALMRENGRVPDLMAELTMMHILAGNMHEAGRLIIDARILYEHSGKFRLYFPTVFAIFLAAKGKYSEALTTLLAGQFDSPHSIMDAAGGGLVMLLCALSGNVGEAEEAYWVLRHAKANYSIAVSSKRIPAFHLALGALGVNRIDESVKWLIAAHNEREPLSLWIHVLPFLSPLHDHPGFRNLVSELNLSLGT